MTYSTEQESQQEMRSASAEMERRHDGTEDEGVSHSGPLRVLAAVPTVALLAMVILAGCSNDSFSTTPLDASPSLLRGLQDLDPVASTQPPVCPFQLAVEFDVPQIASRPQQTLCVAPPTMYEMYYKANMCAAAATSAQAITDYQCEDFNGGPVAGKKVYLSALGSNGRLLYTGTHENEQDFYIWNLFSPLPDTTTLEIYDDSDRSKMLQRVTFPSTCAAAPNGDVLTNTFGAVQITGFTNKQQGDVRAIAPASEPVEIPPIDASFTLSSTDAAAGSYTINVWSFTTSYSQPATFDVPMQGTVLDPTAAEPTLKTYMTVDSVNLMQLPQTLETSVIVMATSLTTMEDCEVTITDSFTITETLPAEAP